jgi:hypothetical protein
MYLIPSFILIPIILLVLYFLNRQHDKEMNQIIPPIKHDVLFDASTRQLSNTQNDQITLSNPRPKLTAEQRLAKEAEIKALKASLKKIQDNKLNLKKVQKEDKIDDNTI